MRGRLSEWGEKRGGFENVNFRCHLFETFGVKPSFKNIFHTQLLQKIKAL
jgi:hypothetical protein